MRLNMHYTSLSDASCWFVSTPSPTTNAARICKTDITCMPPPGNHICIWGQQMQTCRNTLTAPATCSARTGSQACIASTAAPEHRHPHACLPRHHCYENCGAGLPHIFSTSSWPASSATSVLAFFASPLLYCAPAGGRARLPAAGTGSGSVATSSNAHACCFPFVGLSSIVRNERCCSGS